MSKFLEPYNPKWKIEFNSLKRVLEEELQRLFPQVDIQHVGSTSVEGLIAKPILDIDIIIYDKDLLGRITTILEKLGYLSRGDQGIPGRYAFRQTSESVPISSSNRKWQTHHLYVCYADSLALKNHLLFRDQLRKDPLMVQMYSELKRSLTDNLKITNNDYTTKKTDFIVQILASTGLDEKELNEIIRANQ